jgi:predicted MPP superfamily phosphohydrolase
MVLVVIVLLLAAIGHTVLWVTLVNRTHGLGIRRKLVKLLTACCIAAFAVISTAMLAVLVNQFWFPLLTAPALTTIAWTYAGMCAAVCVGSILQRWYWTRHPERARALLSNHTSRVKFSTNLREMAAPGMPSFVAKLPGNQVFDVCVQEKELLIPRLAAAHDGLRIAHVTDLHISGRITQSFYEQVVDEVNWAEPDIVAVTGDLVESDRFLEWLPRTVGRLRAKHGVYCVFGNHDRRATEARLKSILADAGLIHIGGAWRQIDVNGAPLIVAGNELPWYGPAADLSECPPLAPDGGPARILLAHSPDQFPWAQENDIDLMLAGHLHGGQVRLPVLGAFLAPSVYGVRYAAGVFTAGNTTLHVSRGVSSLMPLRYGCPPEIAILKLRRK